MSKKYKNLIYFQNGSIGDFLMTIFFLENIHLNDKDLILNVIVPKNKRILKDFLKEYPFINLIEANRRELKGLLNNLKLLRFSFQDNLVITAPTPGILKSYIKFFARALTLNPKSKLIGFEDGEKINKILYSKLFEYDTSVTYPDFLKIFIQNFGFKIFVEKPNLKFKTNKIALEKDSFVVLHAFGASFKRTLDERETFFIIEKIKEINPKLTILLTGSSKDKEFLYKISQKFDKNIKILINSSMNDICNLLKNSKLFIGVDTGITHIASFLNKKSLVIAKEGTPNWLPYYNDKAKILYSIDRCSHNIFEGRDHLEECRKGDLKCLRSIPLKEIKKALEQLI